MDLVEDIVRAADTRSGADLDSWIREQYGGTQQYVPRRRQVSDAEVMSLFNGANHNEACRRLGISRSRLYRTIRRTRPGRGRS